jgi:nitrite reductase/ring-hydroxylating ferredoxin subunit
MSGKLGMIFSVCHGSVFNVRTGTVVKGSAKKPEPVFEVKVEGEKVLVTI